MLSSMKGLQIVKTVRKNEDEARTRTMEDIFTRESFENIHKRVYFTKKLTLKQADETVTTETVGRFDVPEENQKT